MMAFRSVRKRSQVAGLLVLSCLLAGCPAEETELDRISARDYNEQLASIDDTAWLVTGAYTSTPNEGGGNRRTTIAPADELDFILRFDRKKGVAYGHNGCQSFQMPLGYASGELLSFDLSALPPGDCGDSERVNEQRKFIQNVLGLVNRVDLEQFQYDGDDGQLQLKKDYLHEARLILEPANMAGRGLGPEFGTPLVSGDDLQATQLLADDISGLQEMNVRVIRNEHEFESSWGVRASEDGGLHAVDAVDFTTETVLAVTLGHRQTAGHHVAMSDIEVADGEVRIAMTLTRPHPSCSVESTATRPAAIYSLPTRSRLIRVSTVEQVGEACQPDASMAVQNLSIRVLDETSVQLDWDMPAVASSPYRVSAHGGQTTVSDGARAVLHGLAPGTRHRIEIEPLSSVTDMDKVTTYVATRAHTRDRFGNDTAFSLSEVHTHSLPRVGSFVTGFTSDCGESQAMGLDLSPSECSLSQFAASAPFTEWRTDSTLTSDRSIGYQMDRKGRLFISRHGGQVGEESDSSSATGIYKVMHCIDPVVQQGEFVCSN